MAVERIVLTVIDNGKKLGYQLLRRDENPLPGPLGPLAGAGRGSGRAGEICSSTIGTWPVLVAASLARECGQQIS